MNAEVRQATRLATAYRLRRTMFRAGAIVFLGLLLMARSVPWLLHALLEEPLDALMSSGRFYGMFALLAVGFATSCIAGAYFSSASWRLSSMARRELFRPK